MYREFGLSHIRADGWVKKYLLTQAENLTGEMDLVGHPFSVDYWGNPALGETDVEGEYFLGGMYSENDLWVPYEQTGYWIDGMVRTGYLTEHQPLIEKARSRIMPVVEHPDAEGYLGPRFLKDKIVWAHAVYFRSLTALYSATGEERILEALKRHFLRAPLRDVFEKEKNSPRVLYVRDIADIETALWIYGQTGDERFLTMAEESYARFNEIFWDDSEAKPAEEMRDLTLKGMLGNRRVCRNHGVTYCEICKLPAVLYLYTKKEIYRAAAINAFEKLYRDQMLVDGVHSSTEYLNGNTDSHAMHETCDVSDLTWALGYLYMITGDPKYGDRIENAIFNAGLGAVDDDFRGEQYFSCPNQVVCDDTSSHVRFYRGSDWHSFAPKQFLGCCAGNVHRFMPNFAARAWMRGDREVFAAMYTPSSLDFAIDGVSVHIDEQTAYPFENTVRFVVSPASPTEFTLTLRIPGWAVSHTLLLNGKPIEIEAEGGLLKLTRLFSAQDTVEIRFADRIELIENARGVSIKKGALLYALPVKERMVIEGLRELGNEKYPHYSLYADSAWNFAVRADDLCAEMQASAPCGDEPWRAGAAGSEIRIRAYRFPAWKLIHSEKGTRRCHPRRGYIGPIGHPCTFTPRVPKPITPDRVGEEVTLTLVPYAGTRLRIAIFPIVKDEK